MQIHKLFAFWVGEKFFWVGHDDRVCQYYDLVVESSAVRIVHVDRFLLVIEIYAVFLVDEIVSVLLIIVFMCGMGFFMYFS